MEASRAWRDGLRTIIILEGSLPEHLAQRPDYSQRIASGSETYLQYDDVDNSAVWWLKKGDLRRVPYCQHHSAGKTRCFIGDICDGLLE